MEEMVLLHGFGGTGRSWDPVCAALDRARYRPHAPDLRGHGERGALRPVSFAAMVEDVLAAAPAEFVLVGYSQGGRVAQHLALAAPERVRRLVLVATTAGLDDAGDRAARRVEDEDRARRLETMDTRSWIAEWQAMPVFAGTPPHLAAAWATDLERCRPGDLAAVLRATGTGAMEPLWGRLGSLTMPCDVVVGGRDAKFTALGQRLVACLPDACLHRIPRAGHGIVREAPTELAEILMTER